MNVSDATECGVSTMLVGRLRARGITALTSAQGAALRAGLCNGANLLVCAPTSSGKTTIAEIAAVEGARRGDRTVYLVSHRALAEEKYRFFKSEYAGAADKWFEVSIATGDRTEGDWNTGILIATYEKYLAMVCSAGRVHVTGVVVVADEVQIIGDERRGPEIELLCTLLRIGAPRQMVALTATVSNPQDLAAWLGCAIVQTTTRDVPLQQEVWYAGKSIQCLSGTTEVFPGRRRSVPERKSTLDAVEYLLKSGLGPVLVFTMTKPRALSLAEEFANSRQRRTDSTVYADQIELFSEPSTLVRTLTDTAQKRVAFHTADLNYAERALVEQGLRDRLFDVVFATPTLAAGVNFPFQTVIFDSFYRKFIPERPWLPQSDFQNMAGRAGRMGMHENGFAILLAESEVEFDRARTLISSPAEPLFSRFLSCSLRKVLLAIIAARVIRTRDEFVEFIRNTLWWHQTLDRNPKKLEELPHLVEQAITYLARSRLVTVAGERVFATRLGVATAATGLLPQTVVELLDLFARNANSFDSPDASWIPAVVHATCATPEFGENGQRTLPFARYGQPERNAAIWLQARSLFRDPDAVPNADKVANATYGLCEWISGTPERQLRNMVPPITYGQIQQLGADTALILEGISRVVAVPESGCPYSVSNSLAELAEVLRYGVPRDCLDLIKASLAYDVPGFGRHRAMALRSAGLAVPNDVIKADKKLIAKLVDSEPRADALISALLAYFEAPLAILKVRHAARAKEADIDPDLVRLSYELVGEEYEKPVEALLRCVREWNVTKLDTGKRQGYPDFSISYKGKVIIVECKTKQKDTATLSKDDAFMVLIKGTDFEKDHSLTIGKPDFDEFSKGKATGSREITLLRHQDFVDAILRYGAGKVTVEQLWQWLLTPGYARPSVLEALALNPGDEKPPAGE